MGNVSTVSNSRGQRANATHLRAGISSTCPGSGAKIPTSAYTLPMKLLAEVGFHDTGPDSVSPNPLNSSITQKGGLR